MVYYDIKTADTIDYRLTQKTSIKTVIEGGLEPPAVYTFTVVCNYQYIKSKAFSVLLNLTTYDPPP